jgi:hypothetical protein
MCMTLVTGLTGIERWSVSSLWMKSVPENILPMCGGGKKTHIPHTNICTWRVFTSHLCASINQLREIALPNIYHYFQHAGNSPIMQSARPAAFPMRIHTRAHPFVAKPNPWSSNSVVLPKLPFTKVPPSVSNGRSSI